MASSSKPTIRRGSRHKSAVIYWQKILGITPDGIFGSGTKRATVAWQKTHGLTPDGVVGRNTWKVAEQAAKENEQQASLARQEINQTPLKEVAVVSSTPTATNHPPASTRTTIRRGSRGAMVKTWQVILGLKPDGVFGRITDRKTRAWQKANGLSPDGVVGSNTWRTAKKVAAELARQAPPDNVIPIRPAPAPPPAPVNHPDPRPAPAPPPKPAVRTPYRPPPVRRRTSGGAAVAATPPTPPQPRLPPPRPVVQRTPRAVPSPKKEEEPVKIKDEVKIVALKAQALPLWQKAVAGVATALVGFLVVRKIRS